MTPRRLIELWEPPQGYRLASAVATTYELQADFLEEDLLPTALDLRLPPARGRDFRVELERALQDAEITVFFHPGRYQAGLRRSPRIDLVHLDEVRYPKLHAKVALLRFVDPSASGPEHQVVRLIVGSANLTNPGYRSNIEIAALVEDAPGAPSDAGTAVRDACDWLERMVAPTTQQAHRQFRDMRAVFATRPLPRHDDRLTFIGLPSASGFPQLALPGERVTRLTIASPFWPSGNDLQDVTAALRRLCGQRLETVRLIGPGDVDEDGETRPVIPTALVRSLLQEGARVEVAAADSGYGCEPLDDEAETEFDDVAEQRGPPNPSSRALHAKALLAECTKSTRLAMGSFNLTRKGLNLGARGNLEAGLLWTLPKRRAEALTETLAFATAWTKVDQATEGLVIEPAERDSDDPTPWPSFLTSIRATRDELVVEGDAASWPAEVAIHMRDIRSRLRNADEWFDPWTIRAPETTGSFTASTTLTASWLASVPRAEAADWSALPDLEAVIVWDSHRVTVPVLFVDKHLFPVTEPGMREDEQSLIAWFLGLRPLGEVEDGGFGHSIDPIPGSDKLPTVTGDILSYLIRDFVHALPGVRHRLTEAGLTESGLRAALLGHRSPVQLAQEAVRALKSPQPGRPRKTVLATVFQLAELLRLIRDAPLPELPEGATESLRREADAAITTALEEVVAALPPEDDTPIVRAYMGYAGGGT